MGESDVLPSIVLPWWCTGAVPARILSTPRTKIASSPRHGNPWWHYMASLGLGAGAQFRLNGTAEELLQCLLAELQHRGTFRS